uniref:Ig-like domain-containing protein n=1 Tax=Ceratitis capitata TaxID=7213 RepID=W8BST9_CERCA
MTRVRVFSITNILVGSKITSNFNSISMGSAAAVACKWIFLCSCLAIFDTTLSLSMTEVRIPKHIMRHEDAMLGCKYDLDGESLYSVKWYKDGFEFYRYVPRDMPPGQVFPLPGVDVDLLNSTDNVVVLRRVTLQSTGRYRCEVSGEAPSFQTVSGHEDMIVVVTPKHGPQITGGQPRYQIDDIVRVNCTSAPSKPVCHLSWLINGVHANRTFLRPYDPIIVGREGLEVARLGLEFRVRKRFFKHGDMKLKCVAKISSVYWQSNEESVANEKHQKIPVLESRETVVAKSRLRDKALEDNQLKDASTSSAATSSAVTYLPLAARHSILTTFAPTLLLLTLPGLAAMLPLLIAFFCQYCQFNIYMRQQQQQKQQDYRLQACHGCFGASIYRQWTRHIHPTDR